MDATSTVNQSWRICIFASFIGCIILVYFCQNHAHENLKFSAFTITEVPTRSHGLISSDIELLEAMNFDKNGNLTKKEEEKCNIFEGKWVYDPDSSKYGNPLYTPPQCPFLSEKVSCQGNGRPDFEYERWSWEAKGCDIPGFNGTDMLERLRGKRLILVGDSLNRNQWESLACLLYSSVPSSRAHVDVRRSDFKVLKAQDYNCSVEFYWSPFLVQLEEKQLGNSSRVLKLDKLSPSVQKWRGADVMVFNTGHWWTHRGKLKAWDFFQYEGKVVKEIDTETAFTLATKTWAHWIDQNVDVNRTSVFFRSISPEHKGKHWCYNRTLPIMDVAHVYTSVETIKQIVERVIKEMKTPVRYLNITKLSQYRQDAHPSVYAKKQNKLMATRQQQWQRESHADCSHWCLPGLPDTWNKLLYASMVLDWQSSSDISSPNSVVLPYV